MWHPRHVPDLLTAREVADFLRTSLRTVQRMAEQGRLPIVQKLPGETGAYLFAREDIEIVGPKGIAK